MYVSLKGGVNRIERTAWHNGVYFIAEIGQNHQGDLKTAKRMVDSLVGTGVACIKLAKRDIDVSLTAEQKKQRYRNPDSFGKTYYEHRKALELPGRDFLDLGRYIKKKGFDFASSFTDLRSLRLVGAHADVLKIASSRVTDLSLLRAVSEYSKPIIMSTGMSDIHQIGAALDVLRPHNLPYLLQCTSSYPCKLKNVNLSVLRYFRIQFKGIIRGFGLSGHHEGILPDLIAYSMGATIIERHYTLDRTQKGSDHRLSMLRGEIIGLMNGIQDIRDLMGDPLKKVLPCEGKAMKKLRADLDG